MTRLTKAKAIVFLLLLAGARAWAQDTTYYWTGGAPGYSGTIVLDSPSSSQGSVSDIVSIMVNTPSFGPLSVNLGTVSLGDPAFSWNSSQITKMYLGGLATSNPFDNIFVSENSDGNDLAVRSILYDSPLDGNTTGTWETKPAANVPDAANGFWLLGTTVAALAGLRRLALRTFSGFPRENLQISGRINSCPVFVKSLKSPFYL